MRIDHNPTPTPGHGPVAATNPNPSDEPGFGALFRASFQSGNPDNSGPATMAEAARQMEVHLVTSMLETMDAANEGGLLGSNSEGMGYFKSQFFSSMAEEIVRHQSLGFADSLSNTYAPDPLTRAPVKLGTHGADKPVQ